MLYTILATLAQLRFIHITQNTSKVHLDVFKYTKRYQRQDKLVIKIYLHNFAHGLKKEYKSLGQFIT